MSWPVVKIDEISELVTKGTTPTTYGMPFTDEGINFIKAEALNGDTSLNRSGFTYVSEDTHNKLSRSILQVNDVLLTIAGANVGACGFVTENDIPANTNQAVSLIRINSEKANPRFIYYYFKRPQMKALCLNIGGQSAQPNVNLSNVKNFDVPLPAIGVQNKIVEVLVTYDDLIENNRRRIALLEESARLLYREWFVHLRFPGHETTKIIDGVPEGWREATLGDVAITNPESYKKGKLPGIINYIDISSVSTGQINYKTEMAGIDAPGRARRIAKNGDVIWSNVRPNLRAYSLVLNPHEKDVFSTGFTVLRANGISNYFLYFHSTSDQFVDYLINHATGTSYPAVRPEDFERADMLLPSDEISEAFDQFCLPIFDQISVMSTECNFLTKARDFLLPRLMDGRIEL